MAKQSEINYLVATLTKNDISGSDIYNFLVGAWGEENTITSRRVNQIAKEFKTEERVQFSRKPGSGRPVTSSSVDNVDAVRELLSDDNTLSCIHISALTGIPRRSVNRIITQKLKLKLMCYRWVPYELSQRDMAIRVEIGGDLLNTFNLRSAKDKIIIIDEKWFYLKSVPPKEISRAWVESAQHRPRRARRTISAKKVMIIVGLNYSKSIVYVEVLHDGSSINAERYIQYLDNLTNAFVLPPWEMKIQHDNARPHVARIITQWFEERRITHVKQPAYSPDMNLLDRFIFRNLETCRNGRDFQNSQEVSEYLNHY